MAALVSWFVPKHKHFGLSIGRASLRAVELDDAGRVRAAVELILADTVNQNGVVADKKNFHAALAQLLSTGKFTTSYVGVCFSEAYAYSREYTVPHIPFSEIREAISWHIKELFPFSEADIYFDWKLLESTEKGHRVAVIAVPRDVLDSQFEALVGVGLKPLGFQPGASAIARLMTLKSGQYALIVEVNKRDAYVTLLEGEKALFTTVVIYAATDAAEIHHKNTINAIGEIEAYYRKKGVLSNKSVPVLLTGELANEAYVAKTHTLIPNQITLLKTPMLNPAFNKAYAVAATDIQPPDDASSINLLPMTIQKHYDVERKNFFYKALLIRVCIMVAILTVVSGFVVGLFSLKQQQIDVQTKQLASVQAQQPFNTQKLLLLNAQAANIVALSSLRSTPKDKLQVMVNILPQSITITQWDYDDQKLLYTITGIAQDRQDLLAFRNKLEATGEFAKINLPLDYLEAAADIKFSLTFVAQK